LGEGGDPRDVKLAIKLYKKAAGLDTPIPGGHPCAMLSLAIHYERGIGVERDCKAQFMPKVD
jgi:TPR repeat protein